MTQSEVLDLLRLIDRCYNTSYSKDKEIINDWYKILKQFEFSDITTSLDNYMKNYTTYPPKVYDLTRGYKTIESKKFLIGSKTRCMFCNSLIDVEDEKHQDKCRSIEFIARAVRRFKNQDIEKEKYYNMNEEEFNKYYLSAIKLVVNNSTNNYEVEMWKKYLQKNT